MFNVALIHRTYIAQILHFELYMNCELPFAMLVACFQFSVFSFHWWCTFNWTFSQMNACTFLLCIASQRSIHGIIIECSVQIFLYCIRIEDEHVIRKLWNLKYRPWNVWNEVKGKRPFARRGSARKEKGRPCQIRK